jgi:hypothetical protein
MLGVCEWTDFLALAEELAARPNDEAAARTAISRAYYATFHAGRDFLERIGAPIDRSRNAHRQVQIALQERSARIGQDTAVLHFWRKRADYDDATFPDFDEQAASAVMLAPQTIAAIQALP